MAALALMKYFKEKIRIIFLPFVLLGIAVVPAYTFLRWLIDIKLHILTLDKKLYDFAFPCIICLLAVLIFMRRRLKILLHSRGTFPYVMLATVTIAASCVISQTYISQAAYPLVKVRNTGELDASKYERYYKIENYTIDTQQIYSYYLTRFSGKHDEDLNLLCYATIPFNSTRSPNNSVWYGIKFEKTVSSSLSDAEKEKAYEDFQKDSKDRLSAYEYKTPEYFENEPEGADRNGYSEAIHLKKDAPAATPVILIPQFKAFESRTGDSFMWIFLSFAIGAVIFFISIISTKVSTLELDAYLRHAPPKEDDLRDVLTFLRPRGHHFMTALLIHLNILWYLLMILKGVDVMSPNGGELIPFGALTYDLYQQGDYWRLISSTFVHFGFAHIAYNMVALAVGGALLERFIGRYWLLVTYLVTGAAASLCGIYWTQEGVHAGASGAIFGFFGVLTGLLIKGRIRLISKTLVIGVLVLYAGSSLVVGFMTPNVGNAAHVGGLISGILLGMLLAVTKQVKSETLDV